ncbi:MAG TPA: squalene/phytoene synthase family protein [Atopostipes sp.]|nr:squalene/phytoene synthase family protein [Atopostipes sp.]
MPTHKKFPKDVMRVLKDTSRTFYIPINLLKEDLKQAVSTAYLVYRAIDEIEDHETIPNETKTPILMTLSELFKRPFTEEEYLAVIAPIQEELPEVSVRLYDWIEACPETARPLIMETGSEMAYGMGKWAERNWDVQTKEDLDEYTYYVAGIVGVLLSKLWDWSYDYDADMDLAIGFGRGLQAVNILRNQDEDMNERGVSFVPNGWTRDDLFAYADENLAKADAYIETLTEKSTILFCKLPLEFAHKSLDAMKEGREKMSRREVLNTVAQVKKEVDRM